MNKVAICLLGVFTICVGTLRAQDNYFTGGQFFEESNAIFKKYVENGNFDYAQLLKDPSEFLGIMAQVDQADLSKMDYDTKKAFYLNAYNLTVVKSILLTYPISSTQETQGFFDQQKHLIAGEMMTLNHLENQIIRPECQDARIHFALNCGAKGCPEIINEAYFPNRLNEQLDKVTMNKLNDPTFVQFDNDKRKILLNQIFEWYGEDFGNNKKEIIAFINQYREEKIPNDYGIGFYPYDWSLNNVGGASSIETPKKQSFRYLVSSLYDKGEFEVNFFNNYFAQQSNLDQENNEWRTGFFSNLVQVLVGVTPRFNAGFDIQYRSVSSQPRSNASFFDAANYQNEGRIIGENDASLGYTRTGFSRWGPKVKYLPFKKQSNISVQHTLYLPFPSDATLQGDSDTGWLDWNDPIFWTQVFWDKSLSPQVNIFAEADLVLENAGKVMRKQESGFYQVSTPMTVILSYFPRDEIIFYGLGGYAPQWFSVVDIPDVGETTTSTSYVPYNQLGLGFKYLLNTRYQFEILVTDFNQTAENSSAATYNFGFRYIFKK